MARQRGISPEARARIKQSASSTTLYKDAQEAFAKSTQETKDVIQGEKERFEQWAATDQTPNNGHDLKNLGANTNGASSTRILNAQYYFDKQTLNGDIYVTWRGQEGREKGPHYVFNNVPAFVAKRFMTALSKGKTINTSGLSGGYTEDGSKFKNPSATPFGAKIQTGDYGNVPPIPGLPFRDFVGKDTFKSGTGIPQQDPDGPAQGTLF